MLGRKDLNRKDAEFYKYKKSSQTLNATLKNLYLFASLRWKKS